MPLPRVFDVPLEGWLLAEVLAAVRGGNKKLWIVTANPEILLFAKNDLSYAEILRQAEIRVVDGVGLTWMLRLRGKRLPRVTGGDLAGTLLQEAVRQNWRVGLLGGGPGEAVAAAKCWQERLPALKIHAEESGVISFCGDEDALSQAARVRMRAFDPQVLLVAFGHPKQERWIAVHGEEFSSLRVVVGVGGVFTVWSGILRPAPFWLKRLGLEWAWRLAQQPRRWKRIWRAVVIFSFFALKEQFFSPRNRF